LRENKNCFLFSIHIRTGTLFLFYEIKAKTVMRTR
jgi:hypothetical protein